MQIGEVVQLREGLFPAIVFLELLVLWKTKKQSSLSRSSWEGEYRAIAAITCEFTWLRYVLQYLPVNI